MCKNGKSVYCILGGSRENGSNSGSRCSNWNNPAWNSNWNNGVRAVCDDPQHHIMPATARMMDLSFDGQHAFTGFGKHTTRCGERRVGKPKAAPPLRKKIMGKRYKNLFAEIVKPDNLWLAYHKASLGKRKSTGYLLFRADEAANIARLAAALESGEYAPGKPRSFWVTEPKPRLITALPFVDRIIQHALCNIIEPIFDRAFLPQSYACRPGKGTHRAAIAVQAMLRKIPDAWILKTDFSKFFASIDREILHSEIRRKITCPRTLALLSLFIPPDGRGIPIGNLTSQVTANIYGHALDRWLVHKIGITRFIRYMDDVVVVGYNRESMRLLKILMASFVESAMRLRFSRWSVQPAKRGVNFCGYRIWQTHKLLRRRSVIAAKRKIKILQKDPPALSRFLAAWKGHAAWANSHNLLTRMGVTS